MEKSLLKINNKTVLITGATGFIGGRLAEILSLKYDVNIKCLVRDLSKCSQLARFDSIKFIYSSLSDTDKLKEAISNCDIVFHCAYDSSNQQNNINGIKNLSNYCLQYGTRLVHVSTISVFEPLPDGILDENSIMNPKGYKYAKNKLELERLVLNFVSKDGLDAVIIQPTIVYGPFSSPWTVRPITQLINGKMVLPDQGQGFCNAVYVDDVCNSMILAGLDNRKGEKYLISAEKPVSWREFFESYQLALNSQSIIYMSNVEIKKNMRNPIKLMKTVLGDPKKAVDFEPLKSILISLRYKLPSSFRTVIKSIYKYYSRFAPRPIYFPNNQLLKLYNSKCIVSIKKAQEELGYLPKYDLDDGMRLTTDYISWAFPKEITL